MRRPAVQRAVKAALTSHGFSYTLNAPYEKAAPRYRKRPHSHSFLTRPFLSSCSISLSRCCLREQLRSVNADTHCEQRPRQPRSRRAACFDGVTHAACSFHAPEAEGLQTEGLPAHFERVYECLLQLLGLHLLGIWQRSKVGSHKAAHGFQSILLADQDIAVKSLLFLQDQWANQHKAVKACFLCNLEPSWLGGSPWHL